MDEIDRHAKQHGYRIEEAVRNGNPGYRLIGGERVFSKRVRIFRAAPDKRSRPTVRHKLYEEAKRRLAAFHGLLDQSSQLKEPQRVDVAEAYELLAKSGNKTRLREIVQFYLKHNPDKQACTNRQAVLLFLETKGVSEEEFENTAAKYRRPEERRARIFKSNSIRHRTSLTSLLRKFIADWGDDQVSIMATRSSELATWLETKFENTTTRDNHRRALHNFFNWAKRKSMLAENPAVKQEHTKTSADRAKEFALPGILKPEEMHAYLKGCAETTKRLLPYFVVGAFSGVRTDEISRLKWRNIDMKQRVISVEGNASKTGRPRFIPIHPTLMAWLECIPRGEDQVPLVPSSFETMRRKLRIDLNKTRKSKLPWPANALRHSFGSYRYADSQSIDKTSFEMGHIDTQVTRKHYVNQRITRETAQEYWSLTPSKVLALEPPAKPKGTKKPPPKKDKKAAKRRKR